MKNAGLPYLAVVGSTNCDMPLRPLIMAGAMFGNLAVTFKVGSGEPIDPERVRTIFGGGGSSALPDRRNDTPYRRTARRRRRCDTEHE